MQGKLSQEQLDMLVAQWQKRLRLQDWRVRVRMVHRYVVKAHKNPIARNSYDINKKSCEIGLVYPTEIPPDNDPRDFDLEDSIVHELLHLHHLPVETEELDPQQELALEQMIEVLAEALVTAYRR